MSNSNKIRPVEMFKVMKQKVFQLLQAESKLTMKERGCNQWQLLFQIKGFGNIILGKGGVNTMFYTVNEGERVLLLPNDMLARIDTWIIKAEVTTFAVANKGTLIKKGLSSLDEAKAITGLGNSIFQIKNGKKVKLMTYRTTVFGNNWIDV